VRSCHRAERGRGAIGSTRPGSARHSGYKGGNPSPINTRY